MYTIAFVLPSEQFQDRIAGIFAAHNRHEVALNVPHGGDYACQFHCVDRSPDIFATGFTADVLVARGFMAEELQDNPLDIPVVELPISSNELIFAFDRVRQLHGNRKIGVIGSENMIMDAERIGAILGLDVRAYLRQSAVATPGEMVAMASAEGCEVIVSGYGTCSHARSVGLDAVMIESGDRSIWLAITEAKRAIGIIRNERDRSLRIKAILDYAYEGIIAIGPAGIITMMNGQAGRLLGIPPAAAIGRPLDQAFPDSPFRQAIGTPKACVNKIMAHQQVQLAVNKVPLIDHGDTVGTVVTFQDIVSIQEAEGKIRNQIHAKGHVARFTFDDVIGESRRIRDAVDTARRFAKVSSNILLIGETGTGKEIFAQSIHNASSRWSGPFVAINCAALPENLLESELFGYVEGAFTGAAKTGKAGLFELAHRGTIFLDEISDLPPKLQGRLLRVLQERSIMRLGHDRVVAVDVRIIAATNRDLASLAAGGEFRQDLFFRLNVLALVLPPLRERAADIRIMAAHFIRRYASDFGRPGMVLTEEAIAQLETMPWRGNVRELQNVCERLVVLANGNAITRNDIPVALVDRRQPAAADGPVPAKAERIVPAQQASETDPDEPDQPKQQDRPKQSDQPERLRDELAELEQKRIADALARYSDNKVLAAKHLGISRTTLWRRRKALDGGTDHSTMC